MALVLIKYIMLEGRYKVLIASYFFLLNHFIFLEIDKFVNFPFFVFNSLAISIEKFKQEQAPLPLHGVVIKLVVERAFVMDPRKVPRLKVIIDGKFCEPGKKKVGEVSNKGRTLGKNS